jgi:integrase
MHRHFKRALKEAGLPVSLRLHDLRHAAATVLLSQGVHLKIVSEMLGHANIGITGNLYSHVNENMMTAGG